jgi:hypothetical protein
MCKQQQHGDPLGRQKPASPCGMRTPRHLMTSLMVFFYVFLISENM